MTYPDGSARDIKATTWNVSDGVLWIYHGQGYDKAWVISYSLANVRAWEWVDG